VTGEPCPDFIRGGVKEKGNESRVSEYFFDCRLQWTKKQRVAWIQSRRQWPVFSTPVKVAFAKDDGTKATDIHRI
jgi:hypothetical protein